jgi:hypothetical protein
MAYCHDCGGPIEPERPRSARCRSCDQRKRAAREATAPKCPTCGQPMPKGRKPPAWPPEGWKEHPDGGWVDPEGYRCDDAGRLMPADPLPNPSE